MTIYIIEKLVVKVIKKMQKSSKNNQIALDKFPDYGILKI